jgi:hypothetical protein
VAMKFLGVHGPVPRIHQAHVACRAQHLIRLPRSAAVLFLVHLRSVSEIFGFRRSVWGWAGYWRNSPKTRLTTAKHVSGPIPGWETLFEFCKEGAVAFVSRQEPLNTEGMPASSRRSWCFGITGLRAFASTRRA